MQRVFTVNYTMDNTYIVSGSDDTNIRLWKARASEKLGQLTTREESAMRYRDSLVKKYQHMPTVKKIHQSRKIPKTIKKQTQQAIIQKESAERKQANRIKHSKKGTYHFKPEREKIVDKEVD
jgi:WD repeat and SOF domain-containing protein 1